MIQLDFSAHTHSPTICGTERKTKKHRIGGGAWSKGRFAHDSCLFVYHTHILDSQQHAVPYSLFSFRLSSISFALDIHKITAYNSAKVDAFSSSRFIQCASHFSISLRFYCKIDNVFSFRTYHRWKRLHEYIYLFGTFCCNCYRLASVCIFYPAI